MSKVFASSDLDAVSAELSKQGLKRSRAGARHVLSFTSVAALARTPELTTIARGVLGDDALPFRATFFDKSPNSKWLVACQDTALPLTSRKEIPGWGPWSTKDSVAYAHVEALEQILALRVHLDDSTIENGPLRVIPDSQKIGVLTDQEIQERVGSSLGVERVIGIGGVVAMRPLIIHAFSKIRVRSSSPRPAHRIRFIARHRKFVRTRDCFRFPTTNGRTLSETVSGAFLQGPFPALIARIRPTLKRLRELCPQPSHRIR